MTYIYIYNIYSVTLKLVIPLTEVVKNDEAITGFKTIMFIMIWYMFFQAHMRLVTYIKCFQFCSAIRYGLVTCVELVDS